MIGRRVQSMDDIERPGDYFGPTTAYTGGKPAVFFLKPNARDDDAPKIARSVQHVTSPPHVFRECPDGSLEIRESISDRRQGSTASDGWHGYLNQGHEWVQV
jgi:hypothetical protein